MMDDIIVDQQRHMLFEMPLQLQSLACAATWFIDGTFKVVKSPFAQLLSVHAFVLSSRYPRFTCSYQR